MKQTRWILGWLAEGVFIALVILTHLVTGVALFVQINAVTDLAESVVQWSKRTAEPLHLFYIEVFRTISWHWPTRTKGDGP